MRYIIAVLLLSIMSFSCNAQKDNNYELNKKQYEVLNAFINQVYNFKDNFYLNKYISQKKYTKAFSGSYKQRLLWHKKADSICNNSLDTLILKLKCPIAFSLKKYVDLISEKDLEYFEKTYKEDNPNSFIIDIKKISGSLPIISRHTDEYYKNFNKKDLSNWWKERAGFKEFPSLEIQSVFFSENNQIALVAHSMITSNLGGGLQYSILKKEQGVWWRLIGIIDITYV